MKILRDGFTLVIVQDDAGQLSVTAHYKVASDDLQENRAIPIPLTAQQIQLIKQFGLSAVIPVVKAEENIL